MTSHLPADSGAGERWEATGTFRTTPRMSNPWKRDGKLVCNERFKIHLSLVLINGAQWADMALHQKHL